MYMYLDYFKSAESSHISNISFVFIPIDSNVFFILILTNNNTNLNKRAYPQLK